MQWEGNSVLLQSRKWLYGLEEFLPLLGADLDCVWKSYYLEGYISSGSDGTVHLKPSVYL